MPIQSGSCFALAKVNVLCMYIVRFHVSQINLESLCAIAVRIEIPHEVRCFRGFKPKSEASLRKKLRRGHAPKCSGKTMKIGRPGLTKSVAEGKVSEIVPDCSPAEKKKLVDLVMWATGREPVMKKAARASERSSATIT